MKSLLKKIWHIIDHIIGMNSGHFETVYSKLYGGNVVKFVCDGCGRSRIIGWQSDFEGKVIDNESKRGSKNMPMIHQVSNEELQVAINKTFIMAQDMNCPDDLLGAIEKHLKELLDVQMIRANTIEMPKE